MSKYKYRAWELDADGDIKRDLTLITTTPIRLGDKISEIDVDNNMKYFFEVAEIWHGVSRTNEDDEKDVYDSLERPTECIIVAIGQEELK